MTALPDAVARVLRAALVSELSVIDHRGRVVTYPLLPLFDGERILMTSSVLFSRKLEHIKANPKVAVSVSDPAVVPIDGFVRVTVQGDARVIEDDLHDGWLAVLPLWAEKEPAVAKLVRQRFGLPLFFERSIIEITPTRVMTWPGAGGRAEVTDLREPA